MIVGRGYRYTSMPVTHSGGSFGAYDRCAWATAEVLARWHAHTSQALPVGYGVGSSVVLPKVSGWLGGTTEELGGTALAQSANLAGGKNAQASIVCSSSVGQAELLGKAALQAAVWGDSAISSANLAGLVPAAASIQGAALIEAALQAVVPIEAALGGSAEVSADIKAAVDLFAALLAGGQISQAQVAAGRWIQAALGGVSTAGASLEGRGLVSAEIQIGAKPTAFDIAQAILNAQAEVYDLPGTIGEKINDAGSAGNPWNEVIEAGLTAEEAFRLLLAVLAGKSSGGGTGTIRFRDIGDTKDRVVAMVDENGNRTDVTLDGA